MKHITYNIKKNLTIFVLCVTCYMLYVTCVSAINMQSNDYRIQFGKVDSGGGKMTDPVDDTYRLSSSIGQEAAKEFQSSGYVIKAGFQYIYSRIPFTFYLSTIRVDLGNLLPNTPATGTITLKVSFGGAGQYIVTARADAPLTEIQGTDTISFTGCNGGVDTCTITNAKLWTSASAYGFGYGMTEQDVPTDFISSSYFRPFANRLTAETPATIMQSANVTADITPTPAIPLTAAPALAGVPRTTTHEAIITMKANISGLQPAGTYATVIRFLATPSF